MEPAPGTGQLLNDAQLFKLARCTANFTLDGWAQLLGVQPATVWRWEHGQRHLRGQEKTLVRLLLRAPLLRRRIYLNEDAESLLILGGLVEPIEDSLADYRQLRTFLREINVLKARSAASA